MAFETRYEVTTHVPSSLVAARLPAMCGMETLTTVVSSTSMKVASITENVTTHGFTTRCAIRFSQQDLRSLVTSTASLCQSGRREESASFRSRAPASKTLRL